MKITPTILITGGHLTPALATIEELHARFPRWNIAFVGRQNALEGSAIPSEEYRIMKGANIPFYPISAGRLKREGGLGAIAACFKVPIGIIQAFMIVGRVNPSVVVSFGGYVALPIALASRIHGIPIVTHEQTLRPGLTNRIIASFASRVAVTDERVVPLFRGCRRITVTGLPIRTDLFSPPKHPSVRIPTDRPIIVVTGGNTGSVSVNTVVFEALKTLLSRYTVVHQVGGFSANDAKRVSATLPKSLRDRYIAIPFLPSGLFSWVLNHAWCVIGRSGANTVTEAAAVGAVGIWIPLPWAAANEQYHNAKWLVSQGSSIMIEQSFFTKMSLLDAVATLSRSYPEFQRKAKLLAGRIPRDGAKRFVDLIELALQRPT